MHTAWSQHPKLVNLIRFLLPYLWNVPTLSFLFSLLSLILPYPVHNCSCSFPKEKKISWPEWTEELSFCLQSFLCLQDNWKTVVFVFLQLSDHLSANNLYNNFQSAYRPGHSTDTALLKIVNALLLALNDRNVSLLALLDLSAAFDTIDHSILLHRRGMALDWFSSYLTNRTQCVSIHCYTSGQAPISFSVPQGSVLGPVLFVLYTASLSTVIEKHSVLHHSYADDSHLQTSAPPHPIPDLFLSMQKCIDDIKSWTLNKKNLN